MNTTPSKLKMLEDPARNKHLETLLNERGIPFEFLGDVPIGEIVIDDQVQVRLGQERAPKKNVDRYATIMSAGGAFPAVVVDQEKRLVDGNTRYEAKKKAKLNYIACYQIGATSDDVLRMLAIELNQWNGEAMSRDAIRAQVEAYTTAHPESSVSADVWERRTGVPAREITKWIRLLGFPGRMTDAGVIGIDPASIPESIKQELLKIPSKRLFREVTDLSYRANLPVRDVRELVKTVLVKAKDSEESALLHLSDRRNELAPVIESGGAIRPRPSALNMYRMHLGYIIKKMTETEADKLTGTDQAELLTLIATAAESLNRITDHLKAA